MRQALTRPVTFRRGVFDDVPRLLTLMNAAIESGCRSHYDSAQRRAVFLSYAGTLFVDIVQPLDTIVACSGRTPLGFAQLDRGEGRLRALFVAPEAHRCGIGSALLGAAERLADAAGVRVHGAMALNAVPFYRAAGYVAGTGRRQLVHGGVVVPVLPMIKSP